MHLCLPAVSIVIPVYNRSRSAEAAILSALDQCAISAEVIVVDDGSVPAFTLPSSLCKEMRVQVVRCEQNQGAGAARNTGARIAKGHWLAFLDSDDVWRPNHLRERIAHAEAESNRSGRPIMAFAAGFVVRRGLSSESMIPCPAETLLEFASGCWHCPGSTLLIRRQIFMDVGGFDVRLRRLEDYEFLLRLGLKGGALRVFERVVAEIDVQRQSRYFDVHTSASIIETSPVAAEVRTREMLPYRTMCSYLALERAAAAYYAGRHLHCLRWLGSSFLHRPRTSLHLHRRWKEHLT